MFTKSFVMVLIGIVIGAIGLVDAEVITFDDLPPLTDNLGNVPVEYGALKWLSFGYLNAPAGWTDTGCEYGLVSGDYVSYNRLGNDATVYVDEDTFDFVGTYLTGAWRDGLFISVTGSLDNVVTDTLTVQVDSTSPTWFDFNYTGIDELVFSSYGGVVAGYEQGGEVHTGNQFIMDNFTYVPEPSIMALVAVGALFLRRSKR